MAVVIGLMGCNGRVTVQPRTVASNHNEADLQRVVLPGVAKFDGRLVDPMSLFAWLQEEAVAHDPAKSKVRIVMQIDPGDIPPKGNSQNEFVYKGKTEKDKIMLPDAIKYYASLFGFAVTYGENSVTVRSVKN
jgi:hypothetical protein